jgi:tRNA threonylcarbamoyladenosine biosynthesis protein TsaB
LILHINTALETAYTGISQNNNLLCFRENHIQNQHASFLHLAIQEMFKEIDNSISAIDAVSLVNGPGSYTGLRVGLATAKGICYAIDKPLVSFSSLEWLAKTFEDEKVDLICPLIDARRMEVFTAMFTPLMEQVVENQAKIIDEHSFENELQSKKILFTGNAVAKLPENIKNHPNAIFSNKTAGLNEHIELALSAMQLKNYTDILFSEPIYAKAFFSTSTIIK